MKKKTVLTIVSILTVSTALLSGCGKKETASNTKQTTTKAKVETTKKTTDSAVDVTESAVTVTPEAVEAATETPAPTETPTVATTEAKPAYTFTDMDATKYAKSSVNVRDLPTADGSKVGHLSTNDTVHVTGQCNETKWYRIDLNGTTAYVSNNYLVDNAVTVEQKQTAENTQSTQTTGSISSESNTSTQTASTPKMSELEKACGVTLPATAVSMVETYMKKAPKTDDYVWIDPSTCEAYTSGKYGTWTFEKNIIHSVFMGETVTVHQLIGAADDGWAYVTDEYGISGWIWMTSTGRLIFQ